MKNITYLLLCCLLFICSSLHAQQTDIKGIVSDSSGEPLPGVSISIKGTTFGTITNMDGQFTIRAKKGNTLIFSFIGYQTVEQKATDTPMKVTLQESSVQVDEVVVTALGIKKEKKALAYSVTEVKSEELNRVKVANIANSLVGKVAGVNVVKAASGVMGSSRITIRGNGSLNGSNQPLYVIDGVPMNNGNYGQAGEWGGFDAGDGISSINSEDIESMSVLKGGTAAALYGSRAANGAIVITTKKGTAGKVRVEYNMSYTKDSPILKNNDLQWEYGCGANGMNPDQLAIATGAGYGMTPEQAISQLAPTLAKQMSVMSFGSKMDGSNVTQYDGISRPYSPTARNNFKDFYDNAWSVANNIAVSGGNEKIQFRVGAGDQRFHDMQPNSKLERNNITLNLTSRMNEHFSLKANIMYVRERAKNRPNLGDITSNANASLWQLAPNYGLSDMKITNDDGTEYEVNAQGYVINPLFVVYKNSQKDAKDRIIGSVEVQYNFTPNWYLRGRAGGDMINRRAENVTPWGTARGAVKEGNISNSAEYHGEFNTEAIAGYTNSFKDGLVSVDAFIGWNTMASWSDATSSYGDQFVVPGFNTINNTKTKSGGHSTSESYINSLFGQAEMSYKSMIYLTLTGRNDWFSALSYKGKTSPNHIFYPSVGLGFILSEAIQMPSWFPYLKLRGSWAQSGGAVGAYQLGLTYSYADAYRKYPVGSIDNGTIPNLNLKPLTSISYEGGFEARFFNNRFGIDFTYYVRNTKDDIVNAGISTASGYGNVKINAGKVNNHGYELSLGWNDRAGKVNYWVKANMSYAKNKIIYMDEVVPNEPYMAETGRSTGLNYGYLFDRFLQKDDFDADGKLKVDANGEQILPKMSLGTPRPGDTLFKDLNGDGVIDGDDKTYFGYARHPEYVFGFLGGFSWKNFEFSMQWTAAMNASRILEGEYRNAFGSTNSRMLLKFLADGRWTEENPCSRFPRLTFMNKTHYLEDTDLWLMNGSYLRLKTAEISYTFQNKDFLKKIGVESVRLYCNGYNLLTLFSDLNDIDIDPEGKTSGGDNTYPNVRIYNFGINVSF